jgi:hypothetical protein
MAEGRPQEATERVIDARAADVARTTTLIASTVLASQQKGRLMAALRSQN